MSISFSDFRPKLIAVDFDGTALNEKYDLTPRTEAALKRAAGLGIPVVCATGLMYVSALPFLTRIGVDAPCVFFNGAQLRNPASGEIVYEKTLGAELTADILSFYRENGWYVQIYHEDKLLVEDDEDERCRYYEKISRVKAVPMGKSFWDFSGASIKMLGIAFESDVYRAMVDKTAEKFRGRIYSAKSWGAFIEMVHPLVNKAQGLARVAESLGVEQKDVIAFGDGANDKEMIEWAGVGVVMNNAPDSLKQYADIIAPGNDSDGVAVILERLLGTDG